MAEKDDALLHEFQDLIFTIGKEVSEEISTPVSTAVAKKVINDYVMEELRNMIVSANDLIHAMPKTVEEIQQVKKGMQESYESIEKTSARIDAQMEAIEKEHQRTSEELNQSLLLSRMKKDENKDTMKEVLDQLDNRLKIQNRNIIMKLDQIEHRMAELQEKIAHQDAVIGAIRVELHNRGVQ